MYLVQILVFIIINIIYTKADIPLGSILLASNLTQTWQSPNNTFSLGFIPTPPLFILAVSYSSVPIWFAGISRASASVDSRATFQLHTSGDLRLLNGTSHVIWQTNTSHLNVTSATLDISGNLCLLSSAIPVWSSFDNPTDTLVPGQNLTVSNTLTSGPYSFSLLDNGNLTLRWNRDTLYYNRGLNSSMDSNLTSPYLQLQSTGILTLFGSSLLAGASVAFSSDYAEGSNILRFLKLDDDGNLRIYSSFSGSGSMTPRWAAVQDQCQVFGYCGNLGICSYNDTGPVCGCPSLNFDPVDLGDLRKGCSRKLQVEDCPGSATMLELKNAKFLTYPPELSSQVFRVGISACRQNCLVSGSCVASTSLSDGSGQCYLKNLGFVSGYQSPALRSMSYLKVCGPVVPNPDPESDLDRAHGWRPRLWIVAAAVMGGLSALVILEVGLWWWCCRSNSKFGGLSAQYALLEYASGAPVQFLYKDMQKYTRGFKEKLGEGGFGAVYKGVLGNKTVVAVKQLEGIEQGEKQFRMEVATISGTHHLNLVRLIGFCSEGRHRLLVYEFMRNRSLDTFLFVSQDERAVRELSWETRFHVALGTAKGITYLHEECRDCIVHCDIKPENILLDENYNAKVSDFGLAKLVNQKDHRYRTLTSIRGTRGYLAPEWLANLPITSKSDVYSYGMVLLEIVSGRRNFEVSDDTGRKKFSVWAYDEFEQGNMGSIMDKRLGGDQNADAAQVARAIQVSFWCIQEQPSHRPTMGKVVQMLEGIVEIERPLTPKAAFEGSVSGGSNVSHISSFVPSGGPQPSMSSSSMRTLGVSSFVSARNVERTSSGLC